jgi:hypothetical protein
MEVEARTWVRFAPSQSLRLIVNNTTFTRGREPGLPFRRDAHLVCTIFDEVKPGFLKRLPDLEDLREVSPQLPFVLLDALQGRDADPGLLRKLSLDSSPNRPRAARICVIQE